MSTHKSCSTVVTRGSNYERLKGYEGRRRRALQNGRDLDRTSVNSQGARVRRKLFTKANRSRKGITGKVVGKYM